MITKGVSIPPIRGNIYDSAGPQIAHSLSTHSLYFTLKTGFKQEAAEEVGYDGIELMYQKDVGA